MLPGSNKMMMIKDKMTVIVWECRVIICSAGVAGDILRRIAEAGLGITALLQLAMDEVNAAEFLAVYRGVVHEYPAMVAELSCGPCIALEVCGGADAQAALRQLAGPPDPV